MGERRYDVSDGVAEVEGFYYSELGQPARKNNNPTPANAKFISDMWKVMDEAGRGEMNNG